VMVATPVFHPLGLNLGVLNYTNDGIAPTGGADHFDLGLVRPPPNCPGSYIYAIFVDIDAGDTTSTLVSIQFDATTPEGESESFTMTSDEGWFINNVGGADIHIPAFSLALETGSDLAVDITFSAAEGTYNLHVNLVILGPH